MNHPFDMLFNCFGPYSILLARAISSAPEDDSSPQVKSKMLWKEWKDGKFQFDDKKEFLPMSFK
jgi:hypothetical protein